MLKNLVSPRRQAPYLRFLARRVLRAQKPLVIGITGSVGKTTTTEAVSALLSHPLVAPHVGRAVHAAKNMNDYDGLPLVVLRQASWIRGGSLKRVAKLLRLIPSTAALVHRGDYPKILVLEMGTDEPGMLAQQTKWITPNVGVFTRIGPAHLEKLGSIEGIFQEKMAVIRAVPADGLIVTGLDGEFLARLKAEARAPVAVVSGEGIDSARAIAVAIATWLKLPPGVIAKATAAIKPAARRLEIIAGGRVTIIDDSYNANPTSMKLGLRTLSSIAEPGQRRVAILGDMKELGVDEEEYHREIGDYAKRHADVVIGVGPLSGAYGARYNVKTADEVLAILDDVIAPDDVVLVKGSHSMKLDRIVAALRDRAPPILH